MRYAMRYPLSCAHPPMPTSPRRIMLRRAESHNPKVSGAADMYPAPSIARTTGARWNPLSRLHGTESQR
jgi:hypothetical protein